MIQFNHYHLFEAKLSVIQMSVEQGMSMLTDISLKQYSYIKG